MATNLLELTSVATIKAPALTEQPSRFGRLLQFPSGANESCRPGGERRDGLGCAFAVRLALGVELLVLLSGYGVWRILH